MAASRAVALRNLKLARSRTTPIVPLAELLRRRAAGSISGAAFWTEVGRTFKRAKRTSGYDRSGLRGGQAALWIMEVPAANGGNFTAAAQRALLRIAAEELGLSVRAEYVVRRAQEARFRGRPLHDFQMDARRAETSVILALSGNRFAPTVEDARVVLDPIHAARIPVLFWMEDVLTLRDPGWDPLLERLYSRSRFVPRERFIVAERLRQARFAERLAKRIARHQRTIQGKIARHERTIARLRKTFEDQARRRRDKFVRVYGEEPAV